MKQKLFNPFLTVAGLKALWIGLFFMGLSTWSAGIFHGRFDGVLDLHFSGEKDFLKPLLDNLLNIVSLVLVFYLLGLIFNRGKVRFVDILGTMTLARFPLVLAPAVNFNGVFDRASAAFEASGLRLKNIEITDGDMVLMIAMTCCLVILTVWYIFLLYKAYTVSANLKGTNAVFSFIGGLLAAEIISKILIYNLV